ncbi:MAG: hypothetical protein CM15mP58_23480 [Burkholderiaceae bacterium]|nr:MAG: hypothetical protein CM15mP58_23480 [Burkholderiaceae bacterium]
MCNDGQSGINIKSGGRGGCQLFWGVFLLILCVGLGDWVGMIQWRTNCNNIRFQSEHSVAIYCDLKKHPRSSSIVMLAPVVTVVPYIAFILVGVFLSGIFFAGKISKYLFIICINNPW